MNVKAIIETALPISEMKRSLPVGEVESAIDTALTKLVASLNLKWNLNDMQIKQIVEDLVFKYPNETIEDFILVFRKARQNEFGEIYRLDGAVIFGWMEKYLEEKYEVLEKQLISEKDRNPMDGILKVSDSTRLAAWKASVDAITLKAILPLSEKEVRLEGQEKAKKENHPITSASELLKRERHFQWIKANFDARTGDKLATWIPEEQWHDKTNF